jgi:CMP-N,N'-diacetyllegionaminic acid synthase
MNKTFLAIIPARGGSKRLPRKNLLDLCGKPLIAYSIEAGLKSKYIFKVVVSSDNEEILQISQEFGADIIKRPDELASDTSSTFDALEHTINSLEKYNYIVLLQPTSPLRNEKHIDEAIEFLEEKDAHCVISVCETEHSPLWCNTLDEDLNMSNFLPKGILNKRSQDLPKYYRINGAVYICKTEEFLKNKGFFLENKVFAYIMHKKDSVDIDDDIDFLVAKELINLNKI